MLNNNSTTHDRRPRLLPGVDQVLGRAFRKQPTELLDNNPVARPPKHLTQTSRLRHHLELFIRTLHRLSIAGVQGVPATLMSTTSLLLLRLLPHPRRPMLSPIAPRMPPLLLRSLVFLKLHSILLALTLMGTQRRQTLQPRIQSPTNSQIASNNSAQRLSIWRGMVWPCGPGNPLAQR